MNISLARAMRLSVASVSTLLAACGASSDKSDDKPTAPLTSNKLVAASATIVEGTVGTAATQSPTVRVTDLNGNGQAGVEVQFSITRGGGTIAKLSTVTDGEGKANGGVWLLGTVSGPQTLVARAQAVTPDTILFLASVRPDVPNMLKAASMDTIGGLSGVPVSGQIGSRLLDRYSNAISGKLVRFQAPDGGTLAYDTATTDSSGYATPGVWRLASILTVQRLVATFDDSLRSVVLAQVRTNIPLPTIVETRRAPLYANVNTTIVRPLDARLVNASGVGLPNRQVRFRMNAASGRLSDTTAITGPTGEYSLPAWTLSNVAGLQSVNVTLGDTAVGTHAVLVAGPVAAVELSGVPSGVTAGDTLYGITAELRDAFGTPVVAQVATLSSGSLLAIAEARAQATTDSSGQASFGAWMVVSSKTSVSASAGAVKSALMEVSANSPPTKATVMPEGVSNVSFGSTIAAAGLTARVLLTGDNGAPSAGWPVAWSGSGMLQPTADGWSFQQVEITYTDADGIARPPGAWKFSGLPLQGVPAIIPGLTAAIIPLPLCLAGNVPLGSEFQDAGLGACALTNKPVFVYNVRPPLGQTTLHAGIFPTNGADPFGFIAWAYELTPVSSGGITLPLFAVKSSELPSRQVDWKVLKTSGPSETRTLATNSSGVSNFRITPADAADAGGVQATVAGSSLNPFVLNTAGPAKCIAPATSVQRLNSAAAIVSHAELRGAQGASCDDPTRFNIRVEGINYTPIISPVILADIRKAAQEWETVVTGDRPDVALTFFWSNCLRPGLTLKDLGFEAAGTADLLIYVRIVRGNEDTETTICAAETESGIPRIVLISYNEGRLPQNSGADYFWDPSVVFKHELGHALGFNRTTASMKPRLFVRLKKLFGEDDYNYQGTAGLAAFRLASSGLLLMSGGGGLHWPNGLPDKGFHFELMIAPTHFRTSDCTILSSITIGVLRDLGHTTQSTQEKYELNFGFFANHFPNCLKNTSHWPPSVHLVYNEIKKWPTNFIIWQYW